MPQVTSIRVIHDLAAIQARILNASDRAQAVLTEQVVKDSNYYCRQDQGTLIASSQTASDFARGLAVWDTPYAKRVFYTGNPSKAVNQHAELMWVEKARSEHVRDWQAIAQKALREGL